MSLKNISEVSTISSPEFINLEPLDVNPLMSKAEIKVFYLGHNRNHSYINKETALKMAKTLRGTPIVAAWREEKQDYGDHGHVVTIEDGEVKFSCKTVPYGFVSPDAKIWFQNFFDQDEFGNKVERTYLMTTGYLWTGQFEEAKKAIEEGQPHSMELDSETLEGHWATDNNLNIEFFIINDAIFSKLCILGDDVEPCYEGSSVTSPQVSSNFSQQKDFEQTLFTMMQELKETLNSKGGLNMLSNENDLVEIENEDVSTDFEQNEKDVVEDVNTKEPETSFEEVQEDKDIDPIVNEDKDEFTVAENSAEELEESETTTGFTAEQFEQLNKEVESLRAEIAELREFKFNAEMQEKQKLINSYFMLSDEDKEDIVKNMAEYSLDDIKAKLAILYVEQNVDFNKVDEQSQEENVSSTLSFSLEEETSNEMLTDLQRALRGISID